MGWESGSLHVFFNTNVRWTFSPLVLFLLPRLLLHLFASVGVYDLLYQYARRSPRLLPRFRAASFLKGSVDMIHGRESLLDLIAIRHCSAFDSRERDTDLGIGGCEGNQSSASLLLHGGSI
jgi:hypothetical protein